MPGGEEDYGSGRITITLDETGVVADARDLAIRIQRALDRGTRTVGAQIRRNVQRGLDATAVRVRVEPDLRRFDARLLAGLRDLHSIDIPVTPDVTRFADRVRAALAGLEVSVRVVPDFTRLDERIRAHRPPPLHVPVNPDTNGFARALRVLGRLAGGVGTVLSKGLKFAAIGAGALSAASSLAAFAGSLAPAAGIVAALPAAVLGGAAALGALKLALSGVGDAFGAALGGDPKKFDEALKALSPAAQSAARELRALKPHLDALKTSVQDAFFRPLVGQITAVGRALGGPLKSGLSTIAGQFGAAGKGVAGFLASAAGVSAVRSILVATASATRGLATTIAPVVAGFVQVGAAVAAAFGSQAGAAIGSVGARLGAFLTDAAAGGKAVAWVQGALTVFGQLGVVLHQAGGLAADVFGALNAGGGGRLAGLATILATVRAGIQPLLPLLTGLARLANSVLGGALRVLSAALGPVVAALSGTLVPLLPQLTASLGAFAAGLAPVAAQLGTGIAGALSVLLPALTGLVPVLTGSVLPAFTGLVRAASVLLPAFSSLVKAVAPLVGLLGLTLAPVITKVGRLLAVVLAGAVRIVVPLLAPLVEFGADLIDGLLPLIPVLTQIAAALGDALGPAVEALVPLLNSVGGALTDTVTALAPLVGLILTSLLPVLPPTVAAFAALTAALVPLLPPVAGLVAALVPLVSLMVQVAAPILAVAAGFAGWLVIEAVVPVVSALAAVLDGLVVGLTGVLTGVAALPGLVTAGLSSLGSVLGTALSAVGTALSTATAAVVAVFVALPGQILTGLQALPGLLYTAFTSAIAFAVIGVLTALAGLIFLFTRLPTDIANGLVTLGAIILSAFETAFTVTVAAIGAFVTTAASFMASLPGRVAGALAALPGRVSGAFQSAASTGLASTRSLGTQVVSFMSGLPGRIGSALSGLGGRVGGAISSAAGAATRAASSLISSVVRLFSGLPGAVARTVGNIAGDIASKIKSGLPSAVRNLIPGLASGGIVTGPTHVLVGEAGPEVVIPLTNPKRARQLAAQSGLLGILGARKTAAVSAGAASGAFGVPSGPGLVDAGRQIAAGMVKGIQSAGADLDAAVQAMAQSVVLTTEDTLGISSPSKVLARIGRDTGAGFIVGFTSSAAKIRQTAQRIVSDITAAFKGRTTKLDDRLVALVQAGNIKLQGLAARRDALAKRIADATKFAADTTAAALGSFSLQNVTQGVPDFTGDSIIAGLKSGVAQVKAFTAQVDALAKRGLRKDLLQQLIGLGPEGGEALARTLSQVSKGTLSQINSLQGQLSTASSVFGKASADVLFDAGKQAGAGFLAGLKGQEKAIGRLMIAIAKSMQAALRTALKIRSPSRVFEAIGDLTGAGLHVGLINRITALVRAARRAAASVVGSVAGQLAMLPRSVPASLGGFTMGGGPVVPLTRAQRGSQDPGPGGTAAGVRRGRGGGTPGGTTITNHWQIREVGNAEITAQRVLARLVHAAGVMG